MRERYFHMYESIKYKECFYEAHFVRANKLYRSVSAVTVTISIISVLVWSISKSIPALWAVIIAIAQFAQVLSVNLPYSHQMAALKYLLPELRQLLLQIDRDWLALDIHDYSEQRILNLISAYDEKFTLLQDQFTADTCFPETKWVVEKAHKDQAEYFARRYTYTDVERGEISNAEQ